MPTGMEMCELPPSGAMSKQAGTVKERVGVGARSVGRHRLAGAGLSISGAKGFEAQR